MPQYLIRWPDDRVSYVSGPGDLQDAEEELDCDLSECKVQKFKDLVCLTFEPTIKSHSGGYGKTRPESINTERETLDDFSQLLKSGLLSDVTLEVAGQQIAAHKAILAQRCPYFHAMFTLDMAEAKRDTIPVEGFSYTAVMSVITFIYSGMTDYPSSEQLKAEYLQPEELAEVSNQEDLGEDYYHKMKLSFLEELLAAADYFSLTSLVNLCSQMLYDLCDQLGEIERYEKVLELSALYNLQTVKDHCALVLTDSLCFSVDEDVGDDTLWQKASEETRHLIDAVCSDIKKRDLMLWDADRELSHLIDVELEVGCKMVLELIAKGADVKRVRLFHRMVSMWSSHNTKTPLTGITETLQELVAMGYDIDQQDKDGCTPLHIAATSGNAGLVESLVKSGASLLVVNNRGRTPYEEAMVKTLSVRANKGDYEAVERYFEETASSDMVDCLEKSTTNRTGRPRTKSRTARLSNTYDINPKFIENFISSDESVDYSHSMTYTLSSSGYLDWKFRESLFQHAYPRLESQLSRFIVPSNRAKKTEDKSIKQILECALKADIMAARKTPNAGTEVDHDDDEEGDGDDDAEGWDQL